jgi:hypothetical protein
MGELSLPASIVLTFVTIIFTCGVTWGITTNRAKTGAEHIEKVITELKTVVIQLQTLATDVQVAKTVSARFEKDLSSLDLRVREMEMQVAKLSA